MMQTPIIKPISAVHPIGPVKRSKKKVRWKRWVFGLPMALVAPFVILSRISTWLYLENRLNGWLAIAGAAVAAAALLALVVALVAFRLGARPGKRTFQVVGLAMLVYAAYLILYVSAANLKSGERKEAYRQLHPVLRVAVSSMVLIDRRAIITDTSRLPEDYTAMGLSAREQSMHFVQEDGTIHAVDLRTRGRTEFRNVITKAYFDAMGFSTLRHTGTADHLHVTLPVR